MSRELPLADPLLQRYRDYARQRQMTLGDLLLENRIVFLGSSPETGGSPVITDYLANITIQKLLFLQYENKNQEINMYINCPGGSVTATLAIYDTMQFLECPISTYCMGLAASGAARSADRSATSRSRQPRSSRTGRGSTKSWPIIPASRSSGSRRKPIATNTTRRRRRRKSG